MSEWTSVTAVVSHGSVLGPLFFLIYINDLADTLKSEAKLFADDTSLFSVVYDESVAAKKLKDLETISKWASSIGFGGTRPFFVGPLECIFIAPLAL